MDMKHMPPGELVCLSIGATERHEKDDERPLVQRDLSIQIRGFDEKKRTADFVASTDAIDAYDEIVEQDWILDRFKSNPIILYAHDRWDLPIGKGTRCEVVTDLKGTRLECTIEFATAEMNPKAEQIFQLVKGDFLRAVSVGFRPMNVRYEKRNDKEVYVLSQNVLHEISVVTIPANPEALAKSDPLAQMKARAKALAGKEPPTDAVRAPSATPATEQVRGTENDHMTIEELKAALAAKDAEVARLKSENGSLNEKLVARDEERERLRAIAAEANTRAKTAEENLANHDAKEFVARAEAAEKSVETMRDTLTATEAIVAKAIGALGGPRQKKNDKGEPLVDEKGAPVLESAIEVCERIAHEMVEREVDGLVGRKLDPAQKDEFVALAKSNRDLFERIIKGLPEKKTLGTVMTKGAPHESSLSASEDGDEFAAEVRKELDGAGSESDDDGDFAGELVDDNDE